MKAPLGWLREFATLPESLTARELGDALIRAGLEVEAVDQAGSDVTGPVVIGRVLDFVAEPQKNGKLIRWCQVDVGPHNDDSGARGIVCGAPNFAVGDHVVVALPGAVLPGDFAIAARKTYGHISDGMICSSRELGVGDDHDGIMVLTDDDLVLGADAAPVLGLREDVLDIAVTPDRGYCLSIRGLAREAALASGVVFTDPVDRAVPLETETGYPIELATPACGLFVGIGVTGIDPTRSSPRWLSRRVQLAGMRSISLAVDITNYVMLETGQPLHAYDRDQLDGPIVVRNATAGEKLTTLDSVVRALDPEDLLITDGSGPVGLAGVMGGASSELSAATTSVLIEAAHFDATSIAQTSRRHKLSSEASRRFERGVDPAAGYAAAHRVARLLVELAGGRLDNDETVRGSLPATATTVLSDTLPGDILGADIDHDTVIRLIESVGGSVLDDQGQLRVTAPSWRPDLRDPYDYVEEVGRLIGFDTIEPVLPKAPAGRGLTRSQRTRRVIDAAVVTAGFVEVISFPFSAAVELDRLGIPADDERRRMQSIVNPLADTSPYLRTTLLPGLFGAVIRNRSRGIDDLAVFESGGVFFANEQPSSAPRPTVTQPPSDDQRAAIDAALGRQPRHLAAVLTGSWRPASWSGSGEPTSWTQAVGFVETMAAAAGLSLVRRSAERAPWHPGRCAEFSTADGTVIGYAGEVHPSVCSACGLPPRTAAAEIDLDALIAAAPASGDVTAISGFPVAKEDVALIVSCEVPAAAVESALRAGAGPLLESVTLFDVYTGDQVGSGHKSLAYALRFRADDRTLTDAEAATARDAAVAEAVTRVGAVQRTL